MWLVTNVAVADRVAVLAYGKHQHGKDVILRPSFASGSVRSRTASCLTQ